MKNLTLFILAIFLMISCNEDALIMTQTVELKIDGYVDEDDRNFLGFFEAGQEAGVNLGPITNSFTVTHVRFLFGGTGNTPVEKEIVVNIYKDNGAINPGDLLFSKSYNVVSSLSTMHELDITSENVRVSGGGIRIAIEFTHDGFPSIAHDLDGNMPLKNWNTVEGFWSDADVFGYNGDYIIRATVEEEI